MRQLTQIIQTHKISNKCEKNKRKCKLCKGGLRMDLSVFRVKQPSTHYSNSNILTKLVFQETESFKAYNYAQRLLFFNDIFKFCSHSRLNYQQIENQVISYEDQKPDYKFDGLKFFRENIRASQFRENN